MSHTASVTKYPTGRATLSNPKFCAINGCGRKHYAKDLCKRHYQRQLMGTSLALPPQKWGPTVSSVTAHRRPKQLWGPAKLYPCIQCGEPANHWAYDGTDPTHFYGPVANRSGYTWMYSSSYPEFYMPMCAGCHVRRDTTIAKKELWEYRSWKARTRLSLSDIESYVQNLLQGADDLAPIGCAELQ